MNNGHVARAFVADRSVELADGDKERQRFLTGSSPSDALMREDILTIISLRPPLSSFHDR